MNLASVVPRTTPLTWSNREKEGRWGAPLLVQPPGPQFSYCQGRGCLWKGLHAYQVAWRRGRLSSLSAADERMENSGTCLVATRSAMEESTADSSFLYIIHENRKAEPIISE